MVSGRSVRDRAVGALAEAVRRRGLAAVCGARLRVRCAIVRFARRRVRCVAGRVPFPAPAAGLTLVEALIALVLLGFAAVATASAEAWSARATALAEAREAAAAAAELVLDSLATVAAPVAGFRQEGSLLLEWVVVPVASGSELRLHVRSQRPGADAWFGAIASPAPEPLQAPP